MNSEPSQAKMRQLGILIRGYRDAAGLTQEALSELLRQDVTYSGSRDRSQISNYERGRHLPSEQFLRAFIEAVKPRLEAQGVALEESEAKHLLFIAGYASPSDADLSELRTSVGAVRDVQERLHAGVEDVRAGQQRLQGGLLVLSEQVSNNVSINERVKDTLLKMVPPALYVAMIGYAIDALGLIRTWVLLSYLAVGIGIVASTVLMRRFRSDEHDRMSDLFFVSIFFLLSTPLLQGAFTRMDHYGFHTLPQFTGTIIPFALTMITNLVLSLASAFIFGVLRNWLSGDQNRLSPLSRAVWATLPPIAFLYTNVLLFGNPGMWVFYLATFGAFSGAFIAVVAIRDPELRLDERDGWMMKAAFTVIVIIATLWTVGTFVSYAQPSTVASGDHNTLWSSDPDLAPLDLPSPEHFDALGYPGEQYWERVRFGMLWMSVATILYLTIVLGFNIMSAVRNRVREAAPSSPTTSR